MNEGATDIQAMIDEYAAAVLAKAPSRLTALYAPDVRVFDTWGVWSFDGRKAWGRNLQDWLGSLGEETVEVQFGDVSLARYGETASVNAVVKYRAVDTAGHVIRSMQNRLSWFLTKADGRWFIAHEHTSAPISPENLKAILQRD
jgi:uncharacterized protein (TIGR02246 family)